jgi:AcrR family transcriptional regulator
LANGTDSLSTVRAVASEQKTASRCSHEQRQQAFIAAALKLCDRDGALALTARNLGREMRLSPMAVYRHFESMDHLIAATWNECYERVLKSMDTAASGAADCTIELRCRLEAYQRFATEHPGFFWLMVSVRPRPEQFGMENMARRGFGQIREVIRRGMATGCFHPKLDPFQAALSVTYMMIGMMTFAASRSVSAIAGIGPERHAPPTIDWIIAALRNQG